MKIRSGIAILSYVVVLASCSNKEHVEDTSAKAQFSLSGYDVPAPCTISFVNTSKNATSYKWSLGDGAVSTEINPVHNYSAIGAYTIKLVATGPSGSDSVCKVLYLDRVYPGKSSFSYFMDKCTGIPVNFSFFSLNPQSNNYVWDFGNGAGALDKSAIVQYSASGSYLVTFSSRIGTSSVRDTVQLGLNIN